MTVKKARAGHAEVTASIRDRISSGLNRIRARMQAFAASSARIGAGLVGTGAAGLAPIIAGVKKFMSAGDDINKMAARTNASAESLSTLGFAATESGSDIQTLERGIVGMQRTIRNAERGLSTASDALETVGVSMEDLAGKTPEDQIKLLADGLGRLDEGRRAAVAMEIFGRAGQKLLPMLNAGSEGISEMQRQARNFGLEISTEDANKAAELTDRVFELMEVIKATTFQIGAALAPTLIQVAQLLTNAAAGALEFIRNNRGIVLIVAGVLTGVVTLGGGFLALGGMAAVASLAIGGLSAAIGVLASIVGFLVSPIGLVGLALVGGMAAWFAYSDAGNSAMTFIMDKLGELLEWGKMVFGGVYDAMIAGDWGLAGQIMWTALRIAWQNGIGWLQGLWTDFKFGMLSAFDVIVTGFRSKWNAVSTYLAKGIIWLIDQANSVSEAITGEQLMDTDGLRADVDRQDRQFQEGLKKDQIAREMDRLKQLDAIKKKLGTEQLQQELQQLVNDAREKRAAIEAETPGDNVPTSGPLAAVWQGLRDVGKLIPSPTEADRAATATQSLGSFSVDALSAFALRSSVEKRNAEFNERTADAIEEVRDNFDEGIIPTVTP